MYPFFLGEMTPKAAKYPPVTLVSPTTPADSANLRPNRTVVCIYLKKKKKKSVYKWTLAAQTHVVQGLTTFVNFDVKHVLDSPS